MTNMSFIRNLDVVKNKASEPFYLYVASDLKNNNSTIFGRKGSSAASSAVYSTSQNTIDDIHTVAFSEALSGVLVSTVWCERKGISSFTDLHYAEIDENLNIVRKTTLNDILASDEHVLVRAAIVDDMLLVSWIDGLGQNIKLRLFSLGSLQPLSPELEIEEYLSLNYFNGAQARTANLTLTSGGNNNFFLQFLLESGSICTYQVAIIDGQVTATHLFEQGGENVGFHETLLDEEQKQLLTVYSEDKVADTSTINNIYIISQPIFSEISRKSVSDTPKRVNQSTGFYLRPVLVKYNDEYIVSWEGNKIFYTGLNSDLNIETPEASLDCLNPARIAIMDQGSLLISAQQDNWRTIDYGESLFATEFPL